MQIVEQTKTEIIVLNRPIGFIYMKQKLKLIIKLKNNKKKFIVQHTLVAKSSLSKYK